ncbi:MAG: arginine N-succinyltransferase, partial [Bacteriovoracaceae bacterium]
MFFMRAVEEKDLDDLYELSQLQVFINLPADKKVLTKQIKKSIQC